MYAVVGEAEQMHLSCRPLRDPQQLVLSGVTEGKVENRINLSLWDPFGSINPVLLPHMGGLLSSPEVKVQKFALRRIDI